MTRRAAVRGNPQYREPVRQEAGGGSGGKKGSEGSKTGNSAERIVDWWCGEIEEGGREKKSSLSQRLPQSVRRKKKKKSLWRLISQAQHLANIPVIRTSADQPSVSPSLSTAARLRQDRTCSRPPRQGLIPNLAVRRLQVTRCMWVGGSFVSLFI